MANGRCSKRQRHKRWMIQDIFKNAPDDRDIKVSCVPRFKNAEQFIEAKLEMLRKDFRIEPTNEEIIHLYHLETEDKINLAVKGIINRHWG